MQRKKMMIITLAVAVVAIATLSACCKNARTLQADVTQTAATTQCDTTTQRATTVDLISTTERIEKTSLTEAVYYDTIPLSLELQETMWKACKEYNVPYALALAVADCESGFDLESDNGLCWGIMQINRCNYSWLREIGIEPTEYKGNIVAGVFMLGELLNKYSDMHKALMAYNCGEAGASALWNQGNTTSAYSLKVMTRFNYWQQITSQN